MDSKKQPAGQPPGRLLCAFLIPALKLVLRLRYNFKPPRVAPPAGPFVALGNHASNLDFLFAYTTLYPRRPGAVVTRFFFGQRALNLLMRALRCIPRDQFSPDPASVRAMVRLIRAGEGVLLYPEGEVNGTGRFVSMPEGIGRLCKLLGAPVYAVVTSGSYLTRPKWAARATKERKGRVTCTLTPLLRPEELKTLSPAAIEARIRAGLAYDDYLWQETARVSFRGKDPAEGLEYLLYHCPACGAEFCMQTAGDTLRCTACGMTATLDAYGFLHGAPYPHPGAWTDHQRALLLAAAAAPDFTLQAPGALQLHMDERHLGGTPVGRGVITLDREALRYDGLRDGETVSLCYPLRDFYKTPFNMQRDFEIPGTDPRVSLAPDTPGMVEKFVLAVDALRKIRCP